MASPTPGPGLSLQIKRTFQAPREKVWAAWTERKGLERWMCRDVPTHDPKYTELDVRPGGRYAIEITQPDGVIYRGSGTFLEVKPPEKLVFTWAWKSTPERESLVTVLLKPDGDGTLLTVTHEQFFDEDARDRHQFGWNGALDKMEKMFT